MPTIYSGNDTFPASSNIPSGGDLRNASSVNTPLEALFDRTVWLKNRSNELFQYVNSTEASGATALLETFTYAGTSGAWTKSGIIKVDVPGCVAFDQLQCRLHIGALSYLTTASVARSIDVKIYVTDDLGGGSETDSTALGSLGYLAAGSYANGTDDFYTYATHGKHGVAFSGTCRVGFEFRINNSGAGSALNIYSHVHLEVLRVRA